jgi:hypothetical protein
MCKKVANINDEECDIYIGRPSKWGNPYSSKNGTLAKYKVDTREEAISKYKEWITVGEGKHLLNDLHELKGMVIGCWCKPSRCHGDVLYDLYNERYRNKSIF